jgi:hypothetical protein
VTSLRWIATLGMVVLASSTAMAETPRSIVGWWGYPGGNCLPIDGAVSIEPLALWGDDVRCDFTNVKRNGNTVTWKGKCSYGQGNEAGDPADETVIATEADGKLNLDFGAIKASDELPLTRCTPGQTTPK